MRHFRSLRTVRLALVVVGAGLLTLSACVTTASPAAQPPPPAARRVAPPAPAAASAPELERDYAAVVSRALPSVAQTSTDRGPGSGTVTAGSRS